MAYDKNRWKKNEISRLLHLAAFDAVLDELNDGALSKRLKAIGIEWRAKGLYTQSHNMVYQLIASLPDDQQDMVRRQLDHLYVDVTVQNGVSKRRKKQEDDGLWLSIKEINQLLIGCLRQCQFCTCDIQEQRACWLAKLIDKIGTNKRDDNSAGCGYATIYTEVFGDL